MQIIQLPLPGFNYTNKKECNLINKPKIITLHQPWASAIARGFKKVETRNWAFPVKHLDCDLYVHAAKRKMSPEEINNVMLNLGWTEKRGYWMSAPLGAVVCKVRVTHCERMTESLIRRTPRSEKIWGDWQPNRWAWYLDLLENLEDAPVYLRGRQGLTTAPREIWSLS